MGYKERSVVYECNGDYYDIQTIPGSTHEKGNKFQGTYPLGGTKRKYFTGRSEAEVDMARIKYHCGLFDKTEQQTQNMIPTINYTAQLSKQPKEPQEKTPKTLTITECCKIWLNGYVIGEKAKGTSKHYYTDCNNYIVPYVGEINISELSFDDVNNLYIALKNKPLSHRTVSGAIKRLSQIIDFVIEYQQLKILNVAKSSLIRSKLRQWESENRKNSKTLDENGNELCSNKLKSLSIDASKRFIIHIFQKCDRLAIGFLLSITYGLRPGEVLGLKWEHISFEHKIIRLEIDLHRAVDIDTQIVEMLGIETNAKLKSKLESDSLKSISSKRPIFLSDEMITLLKEHKQIQETEKIKNTVRFKDNGYVFATKYGTPTEIRNYERSFEKAMTKKYKDETRGNSLGIYGKTPHNLRATFATRLNEFGVIKSAISFLLGHSTQQDVTDRYIVTEAEFAKKEFKEKAEPYMIELQKIALENWHTRIYM